MFEEITEEFVNDFMDRYHLIKDFVRHYAPGEYERWKAGGFIVDNNVVSMYPAMQQVVESAGYDSDSDEFEEDEDDTSNED